MNNSLLKELCFTNGISGDENAVRDLILAEIKAYADEIIVDALGNIIAFKKGKERAKNKLLISAHMDEVGFIITNIDEKGLISFDEVGGIDRRIVLGDRVKIGKSRINGVVGIKPIHLCKGEEQTQIPEYSQMYIDIGATDKEDAKKYVSLGDSICFDSYYQNNGKTVISKAIDDRAGCCMMIEMIKSELPYDMFFSFVVQEEVGLRGATTASFRVNPDFAIVLESTTAADIPGVEDTKQVCKLSQGVVVSFMDKRTIYDKELVKMSFDCAKNTGVKAQYKKAVAGGNDAGAIQKSGNGVRTIALSVPCRYLHSQLSVISVSDFDSTFTVATELAKAITGGNI